MADAEHVVCDLINKMLKEKNMNQKDIVIKPIFTDGDNYTTALYMVKLATESDKLDLFAKVAIMGGEIRKQMNADRMYEIERFVYRKLVKIYETLQDKHDIPKEQRFVFPKCYAIHPEYGQETILLENLVAKGYKTYNRLECMDWEHAAISLEQLAMFHAMSFAHAKENPEDFQKLSAAMVQKSYTEDDDNDQIFSVWTRMVDSALDVVDDDHKEKLRDLLMQKDFIQNYNKPSERPVLCHGDYRLSNILFRREGQSLRCIPVDYQTVYSGCPPGDLLFFIFMGSDEEFRRRHYNRLVDHYYESLCQALRRLDLDHEEVYPRETFDKQTKEVFPYVLFLGVVILPVVTVEPKSAPKVDGEVDVSTFVVKRSALYASRFQGIVNDCIRWGVI